MENSTEFFQPKTLRHVLGERIVELQQIKKDMFDSITMGIRRGESAKEDEQSYDECSTICDIMLDNAIAFYNVR